MTINTLQCGRGFRVFPDVGACDASPSASLFSRVAGGQAGATTSALMKRTDANV
jgi:hypothetical protein